jgi:hypothetical protein
MTRPEELLTSAEVVVLFAVTLKDSQSVGDGRIHPEPGGHRRFRGTEVHELRDDLTEDAYALSEQGARRLETNDRMRAAA